MPDVAASEGQCGETEIAGYKLQPVAGIERSIEAAADRRAHANGFALRQKGQQKIAERDKSGFQMDLPTLIGAPRNCSGKRRGAKRPAERKRKPVPAAGVQEAEIQIVEGQIFAGTFVAHREPAIADFNFAHGRKRPAIFEQFPDNGEKPVPWWRGFAIRRFCCGIGVWVLCLGPSRI